MAKIVKYSTAQDPDARGLDKRVNTLIELGYQPFGSPYSAFNGRSVNLCQALVRYDDAGPEGEAPPEDTSANGTTADTASQVKPAGLGLSTPGLKGD